MRWCNKCKKEKPVEEFNFKLKAKNLRHSHCKICTRLFVKNHYNKHRQYYLEKAQKRNKNLRKKANLYLREYLLKHPCVDCGETDITVLEFDHKGDKPKIKAVSQLVKAQVPLEKVKEEIDKCEVRCANCHRRKTAKDFNWFKNNNALVA